MTDTTKKTMTLEQVRDSLQKFSDGYILMDGIPLRKLAASIDAHLSAQRKSLPIGNADHIPPVEGIEFLHVDNLSHSAQREGEAVVKPSHWAAIDEEGDIQRAYSCDDGNGGEAARTEMNQWINDQLHPGMYHLVPLYTAPPHPRVDVTDEMVERACEAYAISRGWKWSQYQNRHKEIQRGQLRAALEAAISEKGHE
jgi:hypothetical protein